MARSDDSTSKDDGIVSPLAMLDASIARGLADADSGRVYDLEAVAYWLDAKYAAMAQAVNGPGRAPFNRLATSRLD